LTDPLLITNAQIRAPGAWISDGWLLAESAKIAAIGAGAAPERPEARRIDAGGRTLLPGFIDLHVHGGAGHDTMDASRDGLREMARFYGRHGVTAFLATTWTDSRARITHALETIAACQGSQPEGATLLGAHLEGPYVNPERSGAQSISHIRRADRSEAESWLELNVIRLLALAPEYEENHWLIERAAARGITVSAAHTAASYDQVREAVRRGLTHATHTFNAMTGLHHREPGTVGAALTLPAIRCELIADNVHVHPAVMALTWAAKGPDGVILITDAIRSAGRPDGEYRIDERVVTVRDGVARLPDGTLAGSTLTMERALANFVQATGSAIEAVWRAASLNAAQAIGIDQRKGSLEPGKDADLVLLDDHCAVHLTVAEGRVVYDSAVQS
jgi:N-acetylglucosamine-6-phosphate deacetylase